MEIPSNVVDVDPNFEPLPRNRSNTWPLHPVSPEHQSTGSPGQDEAAHGDVGSREGAGAGKGSKFAARRNAWGNLSYADLITNAIQSAPDKRLTLSQIYDWMVQNVPFFHDKGESNSSAGWKNSIRHNLSLHNRFMRIPNDGGAGKSSWWVINPDVKPGKTQRSRRANSMETKVMEKKRIKARKRVEALRAAMEDDTSQKFLLNPLDTGGFRDRTSSNASTLSGRLSPIPAFDNDLDDEIASWGSNSNLVCCGGGSGASGYMQTEAMPENLVDSLMNGMRLVDGGVGLASTPEESMVTENCTDPSSDQGYMSSNDVSLPFCYNRGSPCLNVMSDNQQPLPPSTDIYSKVEAISPPLPQFSDVSQYPPDEHSFSKMVLMAEPPGYSPQQQRKMGSSQPITESLMLAGLAECNASSHTAAAGLNYVNSSNTFIDSPHSLSPQGPLSVSGAMYCSPNHSPHISSTPHQQLSPSEVRLLILNSNSNPQVRRHLQQISVAAISTDPLLKALTAKTNSNLSQSQIQRLKHLTHQNLTVRQTFSHSLQELDNTTAPTMLPSVSPSRNILTMNLRPVSSSLSQSPYHTSTMTADQTPCYTSNDPFLADYQSESTSASDDALENSFQNVLLFGENLNDINLDGLQVVDSDIDQVLEYEMSLDSDFDFNFDVAASYNHR